MGAAWTRHVTCESAFNWAAVQYRRVFCRSLSPEAARRYTVEYYPVRDAIKGTAGKKRVERGSVHFIITITIQN